MSSLSGLVSGVAQRIRKPGWPLAHEVQPLSLAGTGSSLGVTLLCVAGIVAVTALESQSPGYFSLGSLLFIPVVAAAWLLGTYEAGAVFALATAARLLGYGVAGINGGTAIAEVTALGFLGLMTRLAAVAIVDGRQRAARMERDRRALELLEQREQIARSVSDTASRRLYSLTIRLQAASAVEDRELRLAVREAIDEMDALNVELRRLIFTKTPDPD